MAFCRNAPILITGCLKRLQHHVTNFPISPIYYKRLDRRRLFNTTAPQRAEWNPEAIISAERFHFRKFNNACPSLASPSSLTSPSPLVLSYREKPSSTSKTLWCLCSGSSTGPWSSWVGSTPSLWVTRHIPRMNVEVFSPAKPPLTSCPAVQHSFIHLEMWGMSRTVQLYFKIHTFIANTRWKSRGEGAARSLL